MKRILVQDIDAYIETFPDNTQRVLERMRAIIRKAAPQAEEAIKYAMPTFVLNGNLVHFAAMKSHIGFYPAPSGIQAFKKELAAYKTSKGAIQFPTDKPLPTTLIAKIVKFRVQENLGKAKTKVKVKNKASGVNGTAMRLSKSAQAEGTTIVDSFLDNLSHPLKKEILILRQIILQANRKLTEHIKWNAPSFCIDGDDRITMKLFPPKNIQLIFHRGAKVKAQPKERLIQDQSGLLKWMANDRAMAEFVSAEQIISQKKALSTLINVWISAAKP